MFKIENAGHEKAELVFDFVVRLLKELEDDPDEFRHLDFKKIAGEWKQMGDRFNAFIALDDSDNPAGIITLVENFAVYANGSYGIINEMYVRPDLRSTGLGKRLIETVKEYAKIRGWVRIDVTAPPGEKWRRTVGFYEREGFTFTGPKLRFLFE